MCKIQRGGGCKCLIKSILRNHCRLIVDGLYGNIWDYREHVLLHPTRLKKAIYYAYLDTYGAWIGLDAVIENKPICPHECYGLFISNSAHIGQNVVIFHQVTIGSVSTIGSKHQGAPTIGNNVYIGCGAKIIGNVHVGDNVRIGANTVVTRDVPANSIVHTLGTVIENKDELMDNRYIYYKSK